MIATILKPFTKPNPAQEQDDDDVWCIQNDEFPEYTLCGDDWDSEDGVPYDEVPDELTCHKCLRVEKTIEKLKKP